MNITAAHKRKRLAFFERMASEVQSMVRSDDIDEDELQSNWMQEAAHALESLGEMPYGYTIHGEPPPTGRKRKAVGLQVLPRDAP